nr:putative disease resistance RPP13-like protein 3 [Ipomoea batatas]
MAYAAVTILMDTLLQNFLQPKPIFTLRRKKKVRSLYRNLCALQTSLLQNSKSDEAVKGLEARIRDVSVELRFQIEQVLVRLFHLGKAMKARRESAQKLLRVLNRAIKYIKTEDLGHMSIELEELVLHLMRKYSVRSITRVPGHIKKMLKSLCIELQLCCSGALVKLELHFNLPGMPVHIKKRVKSLCKNLRFHSSSNEKQSPNISMQRLIIEAKSLIIQELRAYHLKKYRKQREEARQRLRLMFRLGNKFTAYIKKELLKGSESWQQHNATSLGDLEHNKNLTVMGLVHLRYLSFEMYHSDISYLPWFMLRNLQILKVDGVIECGETAGIMELPHVRHLYLKSIYLQVPPRSVQDSLESVYWLDYRSCTKELFMMTPNLMKLGIHKYRAIPKCREDSNWFESLAYLYKLQELDILGNIIHWGLRRIHSTGMCLENYLPNLKKLKLAKMKLEWKDIDVIGTLPNLEVLKLRDAVYGPKWEPTSGRFLQLKYLLISGSDLQYWEATADHFPMLERLALNWCYKLEEIPRDFADIATLRLIELLPCSDSIIVCAEHIREVQQDSGNDAFVLHYYDPIREMIVDEMINDKDRSQSLLYPDVVDLDGDSKGKTQKTLGGSVKRSLIVELTQSEVPKRHKTED